VALQLILLAVLWLLPSPPESLPDPGLAHPPIRDQAPSSPPSTASLQDVQLGVAALDRILAARVTQAAAAGDQLPERWLPSPALRATALASTDSQGAEVRALLAAYREALEALGAPSAGPTAREDYQ